MIAVDTNVVVRLLTGDDPGQARRARTLFDRETVFLSKTVLLESEWVLRRLYGFAAERILDALAALIALPNVRCEDDAAIADALQWSAQGIDFADALHCASAPSADQFASFDARLVKRARRIVDVRVVAA